MGTPRQQTPRQARLVREPRNLQNVYNAEQTLDIDDDQGRVVRRFNRLAHIRQLIGIRVPKLTHPDQVWSWVEKVDKVTIELRVGKPNPTATYKDVFNVLKELVPPKVAQTWDRREELHDKLDRGDVTYADYLKSMMRAYALHLLDTNKLLYDLPQWTNDSDPFAHMSSCARRFQLLGYLVEDSIAHREGEHVHNALNKLPLAYATLLRAKMPVRFVDYNYGQVLTNLLDPDIESNWTTTQTAFQRDKYLKKDKVANTTFSRRAQVETDETEQQATTTTTSSSSQQQSKPKAKSKPKGKFVWTNKLSLCWGCKHLPDAERQHLRKDCPISPLTAEQQQQTKQAKGSWSEGKLDEKGIKHHDVNIRRLCAEDPSTAPQGPTNTTTETALPTVDTEILALLRRLFRREKAQQVSQPESAAKINGMIRSGERWITVPVVLDTGADTCCVGRELVQHLHLTRNLQDEDKQIALRSSRESIRLDTGHTVPIAFRLQGITDVFHLTAIELRHGGELLLGIPWLRTVGLDVTDWISLRYPTYQPAPPTRNTDRWTPLAPQIAEMLQNVDYPNVPWDPDVDDAHQQRWPRPNQPSSTTESSSLPQPPNGQRSRHDVSDQSTHEVYENHPHPQLNTSTTPSYSYATRQSPEQPSIVRTSLPSAQSSLPPQHNSLFASSTHSPIQPTVDTSLPSRSRSQTPRHTTATTTTPPRIQDTPAAGTQNLLSLGMPQLLQPQPESLQQSSLADLPSSLTPSNLPDRHSPSPPRGPNLRNTSARQRSQQQRAAELSQPRRVRSVRQPKAQAKGHSRGTTGFIRRMKATISIQENTNKVMNQTAVEELLHKAAIPAMSVGLGEIPLPNNWRTDTELESWFKLQPQDVRNAVYNIIIKQKAMEGNHPPARVPPVEMIVHVPPGQHEVSTHKPTYGSHEELATAYKEMQQQGIVRSIHPTRVKFASNTFMVERKGTNKRRVVVNLVKLNKYLQPFIYILPIMETVLIFLADAKYITQIDLRLAYFSIPLSENSQPFFSVYVPGPGYYAFTRLPMGAGSSPAIFQAVMDGIMTDLQPQLHGAALAFFDNVYVTDNMGNRQNHLRDVETVLNYLTDLKFVIQIRKCEVAATSTDVFGYTISGGTKGIGEGMKMLIQQLAQTPPNTKKRMISILGTIQYISSHVPNFASKFAVFRDKATNSEKDRLQWVEDEVRLWRSALLALLDLPLLTIYNSHLSTRLTTDYSTTAMAVTIEQFHKTNAPNMQDSTNADIVEERIPPTMELQQGQWKLNAFASRRCTTAESSYSPYKGEMAAINWALQRHRGLLLGKHIILRTDCYSLIYANVRRHNDAKIMRMAQDLAEFHIYPQHLPGADNTICDMLSRTALEVSQPLTIKDEYGKIWSLQQHQDTKEELDEAANKGPKGLKRIQKLQYDHVQGTATFWINHLA